MNGFTTTTPQEYAKVIRNVLLLAPDERDAIRKAAGHTAKQYSEEAFKENYLESIKTIFK